MPFHILIINPNSNASMTESLRASIESMGYNDTIYTYLTAPSSSPYSINDLDDADASTAASLPLITKTISSFSQNPTLGPSHNSTAGKGNISTGDGNIDAQNSTTGGNGVNAILIACYSPHPLVPALLARFPEIPCIDIFAASVSVSLQLLGFFPPSPKGEESAAEGKGGGKGEGRDKGRGKRKRFGIVSTGPQWEGILSTAIERGGMVWERLAGVECVGLNAGELHLDESDEFSEEGTGGGAEGGGGGQGGNGGGAGGEVRGGNVERAVREATARLLARGDVGVVVLGCAGMVGMEGWAREEVGRWKSDRKGVQGNGEEGEQGKRESGKQGKAGGVKVVDGVKAGVGVLQGIVRGGF